MSWFKIDDIIFEARELVVNTTIGSHVSIDLHLENRKDYKDFFFDKYDKSYISSSNKFTVITKEFTAFGTLIKSISFDDKSLKIKLTSDYFETTEISERRDEILEEILNKNHNS